MAGCDLFGGCASQVEQRKSERRGQKTCLQVDSNKDAQPDGVMAQKRVTAEPVSFRAAPRARLSHLSFENDRALPAQC